MGIRPSRYSCSGDIPGRCRISRKDPDPKEFTDPRTRSYREGTLELLRSLTLGMPPKDLELFIEQFKGRVLSDIANERLRRELEKGRSQ
jgi:hypothetical protein